MKDLNEANNNVWEWGVVMTTSLLFSTAVAWLYLVFIPRLLA